jgi:hypothetical protein
MTPSLLQIVPKNKLSIPEFREWICGIEERMKQNINSFDRHDDDDSVKHIFTPGLYSRQLFMKKGLFVISRIHMFEHPFIISKGDVSVYDGNDVVRLKAPYQGITKPGTKRILYTHKDTIWTTFHTTDKKTIEEIDEDGVITCSTFEQYSQLVEGVISWRG